jgi:purine-binding chemotaxis protein CheW
LSILTVQEIRQHDVVTSLAGAPAFIGVIVDSVSDVVALSPDQIRPLPELGQAIHCDHLTGLGMIDDRMILLLDISKLLVSSNIGPVETYATC